MLIMTKIRGKKTSLTLHVTTARKLINTFTLRHEFLIKRIVQGTVQDLQSHICPYVQNTTIFFS